MKKFNSMNSRFPYYKDYPERPKRLRNTIASSQQPLTNTLLPQFRNLITSIFAIWILTKRTTNNSFSNPHSRFLSNNRQTPLFSRITISNIRSFISRTTSTGTTRIWDIRIWEDASGSRGLVAAVEVYEARLWTCTKCLRRWLDERWR